MIAFKRGWWMIPAILGLAMLPGWCAAQTTDVEKALKDAEKAQREAQQAAEKALQDARVRLIFQMNRSAANRLGTTLESPSAAVATQLDLPAGQGQVVKAVQPNSTAAKAGIQANDIILELDGKPVSSNMAEFEKVLSALKPETGVDAVVLRKGQKTTIKGLIMPKQDQPGQFGGFSGPATIEFTRPTAPPQVPGQLVPAEVQGQLRLTAEQKEKLARLQKDTEAKFMEILTDEQKKRLDELKKNAAGDPGNTATREVWLGVQVDFDAETCTIVEVLPGSPAEKAGLKPNDMVLKFDGQKVESFDDLAGFIRKKKAGDEVTLEVKRGNDTMKVKATLARRGQQPRAEAAPMRVDELKNQLENARKREEEVKKQLEAQQAQQELALQLRLLARGAGANRLGAFLETPSDAVATQLNLPQGQGVVVKTVPPNSPAAKAGLQSNDILLELGGKTISRNPAEFDKAVEQIKSDATVDALVLRKGEKTTVKGVALAAAAAPQQATRVRAMNPAAKVPGDILPAEVQGQLRLTPEQKEKLARLQKDTEAKLMELLTDEQKKQLEEIKKNQAPAQLRILIENLLEQQLELNPPRK